MSVFEDNALQWAIEHDITPSQVRSATIEQIAVAAQATVGQDGFFPQNIRRFVADRLRRLAQDGELIRLAAILEARIQQEYPQALVSVERLLEYGRCLVVHAIPVDDITGE